MTDFWEGKRVLVAGGAGMIGSHIVEQLYQKDVSIINIIDDLSIGRLDNLKFLGEPSKAGDFYVFPDTDDCVVLVPHDLCKGSWKAVEGIIHPVDVVINLASPSWGLGSINHLAHADNFYKTLQIHFNLFHECQRDETVTHYFVAGSSCEDRECPLPERDHEGYAWAKRMLEQHILWTSTPADLAVVKGNLWNIYGPRENPDLGRAVTSIIRRALQDPLGGPLVVWGDGNQIRNYLYVEDCARMILNCIASTHPGTFSIRAVAGVDMTVRDLTNIIMTAMDSPREVIFKEDAPTGTPIKAAHLKRPISGAATLLQSHMPIYTSMRKTVRWIQGNL